MCKIISLFFICVLYLYSYRTLSFNTSDTNLLKQNHKHSVASHVASILKNKKEKENEDDEEDEGFGSKDDEEEEEDKGEEKEDEVDAELDKVQEKEEEEEKMLEDAEDVGVKESIEEEKSEDEFVNERIKEEKGANKDTGKETLRYLMDEMVKLSLELKEINSQINSLY